MYKVLRFAPMCIARSFFLPALAVVAVIATVAFVVSKNTKEAA